MKKYIIILIILILIVVVYAQPISPTGTLYFLHLNDTPVTYTDQSGKGLRVNTSENAVEFYTITTELGTDTTGNYVAAVADGTGIDGTATGEGSTYTPTFDATELDALTWSDNANASNIWTFDVSGTDHTMTAGSALMTFSGGLTTTLDLIVTGGDITLGTTSIFSGGDTASLNNIDALNATTEATIESAIDTLANLTSIGTIATGVWQGTDVGVAHGGTGASTLTDGGILLGSGTSAVSAMSVLADGTIVIGDGTTDPNSLAAFTGVAGTLKHESGGLEANVSGYTDGIYGMASGATLDIDTIAEIETAIGGSTNILTEAEIDASSELLALMDDETGTGLLVFATAPTFTTSIKITGADANPGAAGVIVYDSTVSGMSGGAIRWYDDDSVRLIVDLETDATDDDYVVAYDAAADGFYMKADADSGGATVWDDIGNPDANDIIDFGAYYAALDVNDFRIGATDTGNYMKIAGNAVTFVGTGDIDLPNNSVDSADVNFNYAASSSEAGSASSGDAAVDFFGAGVDAVTDATTCTDIEGTGLSITTSVLNWAYPDGDAGDFTYSSGSASLDPNTVAASELAAGDYGDMTISAAGVITLDPNTVAASELAAADYGDWTISAAGAATLDDDTVAVAEFLASQDWGDMSTAADGTVSLDTGVVADNEIDYTAVTGADLTLTDAGAITSTGTITATVGFDIVGAADMDYGSADVTDHTFLSDGTGTGEFVLKAGAIDGTEILDDTIDSADYAAGSIDAEHLAADVISGMTDVNSADADYIMIWDATDSGLKKCDMGEVRGGAATAYDDIGDPDAAGSISFDAAEGATYTSSDDEWVGVTISNTQADNVGDTELLTLAFTDDGDTNSHYLIMSDAAGTQQLEFIQAGGDIQITTAANLKFVAGGGNIDFADDNIATDGTITSLGASFGGTLTVTTGGVDFGGALSVEITNGTDPDVDAAGEISIDTDGANEPNDVVLRTIDGGGTQVALAQEQKSFQATIITPNDLADATRDACPIWSNETGMTFVITKIEAWADVDDTAFNVEVVDANGVGNNATVDAINCTTGLGPYTATETTITAANITANRMIFLDFDDTDDPGWVKISICGYFLADVD